VRWKWLGGKDRTGLPSRVLLGVDALLGACLTALLPVMIVVLLLAALGLGILFYWFLVRPGRHVPVGTRVAMTPMRYLAEVTTVAGVLLIAGAAWLTILGLLTQFGMTSESTARWSELAAMGFQVTADQPAAFGARCLVVAAAVWAVGFGLTRASGGRA
jgi:hypothetical protein